LIGILSFSAGLITLNAYNRIFKKLLYH